MAQVDWLLSESTRSWTSRKRTVHESEEKRVQRVTNVHYRAEEVGAYRVSIRQICVAETYPEVLTRG